MVELEREASTDFQAYILLLPICVTYYSIIQGRGWGADGVGSIRL